MNNPLPQRFLATTPGLSATRWLSFALASHPDVFVAHGRHPLDSIMRGDFTREKKGDDTESFALGIQMAGFYQQQSLEGVFAAYQSLKPNARACGNVHTFTLESLMLKVRSVEELQGVNILNVLRHPVNYIASHTSLVRTAAKFPEVYKGYAEGMFPQALNEFPELFLFECEDFDLFLAFAVSCLSVWNLANSFVYPGFKHVQMETLTTDLPALQSACESLTGLSYPTDRLKGFIEQGAINQHRKGPRRNSALEIYQGWAVWQQDMARMMIPTEVLDALEEFGYDVSMLRTPAPAPAKAGGGSERKPVRSLGDLLHPRPGEAKPRPERFVVKQAQPDYRGFRLLAFDDRFYALDAALGQIDLTQIPGQVLRDHHKTGRCFVADSIDVVRKCVDLEMRRRGGAPASQGASGRVQTEPARAGADAFETSAPVPKDQRMLKALRLLNARVAELSRTRQT